MTIPVLGLGSVTLTINEQISSDVNNITVNALRVDLSLTGLAATSITISAAHSDLSCAISTTAAKSSISGHVFDDKGHGLSGVTVKAMDNHGVVRSSVTNSSGLYRIDELETGMSYIVSADQKRFTYPARIINLQDDLSNVDFTPQDKGSGKGKGPR